MFCDRGETRRIKGLCFVGGGKGGGRKITCFVKGENGLHNRLIFCERGKGTA